MEIIGKAIKFFEEEIIRLRKAPEINGCEMTPEWAENLQICHVALRALKAQKSTDLPDRNDKNITVSDIFKTDDGHIGTVTFGAYKQDGAEHYGFYIKWNDNEHLRKDILYWIDKGIVIGNIHDNPELAEGAI